MQKLKQEFLIYSFLGWILENCYNKKIEGTFLKANFLHGPIKPMYGVGGVLLVQSYRHDRKHFRYAAVMIPLMVEWCCGRWLDKRYQLKYWDYSQETMQVGGYICLKFALCWILLARVVVYLIQPMLERWLNLVGRFSLWQMLFRGFVLDVVLTLYRREQTLAAKVKHAC